MGATPTVRGSHQCSVLMKKGRACYGKHPGCSCRAKEAVWPELLAWQAGPLPAYFQEPSLRSRSYRGPPPSAWGGGPSGLQSRRLRRAGMRQVMVAILSLLVVCFSRGASSFGCP